MKIIVTGGSGFIGGNFVHYMLDRHPEDEIICVDCLTYAGNMETLASVMDNPKFQFEKLDITDREGIYGLFEREHPDIVRPRSHRAGAARQWRCRCWPSGR